MFALRNASGAYFVCRAHDGAAVWSDARCVAHWFPRTHTARRIAASLALDAYSIVHVSAGA